MTAREIADLIAAEYPWLFRNNRGRAMATDRDGKKRMIRFGIPEPQGKKETDSDFKGGDYIGWIETEITAEMVGKKIAVFASIEIKTENDRIIEGQKRWAQLVAENGGIAEIWHEKKGEIIKKRL
jgi:hypothetical protein